MLSYKVSRLFYDLHADSALAAEYRSDRDAVIGRYKLAKPVVDALRHDEVAVLAKLTNGFLLRYYFLAIGMSDRDFIAGLQSGVTVGNG